jgi:type IV pilus assembly protein PilX
MRSVKNQTGSILIISLLLLIVTTLLGLSSMNNTIMEEKMAGNLRQQNLALQSAESSLRQAEAWLASLDKNTRPEAGISLTGTSPSSPNPPDPDADEPYIWLKDAIEGDGGGIPADPTGLWWVDSDRWSAYGFPYSNDSGALDELTGFFIIEELEPVADTISAGQQSDTQSVRDYFQVTTYGRGMDGRASAYLRSTFSRRF